MSSLLINSLTTRASYPDVVDPDTMRSMLQNSEIVDSV